MAWTGHTAWIVATLALVVAAARVDTVGAQSASAICYLGGGGEDGARGVVVLRQEKDGADLEISGIVFGLNQNSLHGFHIHRDPVDFTEGCTSTGPHYNPTNTNHGAPTNDPSERHVGDLGNILSDENGAARFNFTDPVASLFNEHSIMGRAIVVHGGEDDLGLGGNDGSLASGNAGPRIGCCDIVSTQNGRGAFN